MPYIKQDERHLIDVGSAPKNAGQLNFAITIIIHEYLDRVGVRYSNINECIGVLECAKLELYRRIASVYEDKKIIENGDLGILPKE